MSAFKPLDHLLAEYLGWPLACAPLLRVGLKCTGWWHLYKKLYDSLYSGGYWEEWFPNISVSVEGIEGLPSEGGYSLVVDHPLGLLDGWAMGVALKDRMNRVAFFAHPILAKFPALASYTIPMKPGSDKATREIRASLRRGAEHMARGGILVRFISPKHSYSLKPTLQVIRVEITPIWGEGQALRKTGTWWTWLWLPKSLNHLQGLKLRFTSAYQV